MQYSTPSQFQINHNKNKNLNTLISLLREPFEEFSENIKNEGGKVLDIENSKNKLLSHIGDLLDAQRGISNDDNYRVFVKLKSKLNNSDSSADFMMYAFDKSQISSQFFYTENPLEIKIYANLKQTLPSFWVDLLKKSKACGVNLKIFYTINDQIWVLSESNTNLLINSKDENQNEIIDHFLLENQDNNLLISDLSANGSLENQIFTRPISICDGDFIFAIENGDCVLVCDSFDVI